MSGQRARYAVAGAAMRRSYEAARAAGPKRADLLVLMAIHHQVGTYSRLEDTLTRKKLASLSGVSERTVTDALQRLADCGAIVWAKSKGRGLGPIRLPETGTGELLVSLHETGGDVIGNEKPSLSEKNENGKYQASQRALSEKKDSREDFSPETEKNVLEMIRLVGGSEEHAWNDRRLRTAFGLYDVLMAKPGWTWLRIRRIAEDSRADDNALGFVIRILLTPKEKRRNGFSGHVPDPRTADYDTAL